MESRDVMYAAFHCKIGCSPHTEVSLLLSEAFFMLDEPLLAFTGRFLRNAFQLNVKAKAFQRGNTNFSNKQSLSANIRILVVRSRLGQKLFPAKRNVGFIFGAHSRAKRTGRKFRF